VNPTTNITDALKQYKAELFHLNQASLTLAQTKRQLIKADAERKIAEAKAYLAADGTEKQKTAAAVVAIEAQLMACATIEGEVAQQQADVDVLRRRRDLALEIVRAAVAFGEM
jgi:hypothetical protein